MSKFVNIKNATKEKFDSMSTQELFVTDISKDELWDMYLGSFKPGTNPIYKERTEHDCQCCKQFIRACGNVVSIEDGKLISIWDVNIGGDYQVVADALSKLVKSKPIKNKFLHYEKTLGTDFNRQLLDDGSIKKWSHFYYKLPKQFVKKESIIGKTLSKVESSKDVFKRGLDEISLESIEITLELIEQNSLHRGQEYKNAVAFLLSHKLIYTMIKDKKEKDNYCWLKSTSRHSNIRNTAIGTLLLDISKGIELDISVIKFESKVSGNNYKRTTAVTTPGMQKKALEKINELGLKDSLSRRYSVKDDITINNVLFADRTVKKSMGALEEAFDILSKETPDKKKNFSKAEEVSINDFIENILPKANTIELMFENEHSSNLVSLISPIDKEAKALFKWDNNFSWYYNGDVADSVKERVKQAGGNVEGFLRCSLSWFNYDDLDIHIKEPNGNHIYFGNKGQKHPSSAMLDVDMNAGYGKSRNAVENIIYTDKNKIQESEHILYVNNYQKRESSNIGFDMEIDCDGDLYNFHYDKVVRDKENVEVARFLYSKKEGIVFTNSLQCSQSSKEYWGINTQKFHKVLIIMNSPNYWDDKTIGNKQWFFVLEDCKNPETARGFFNEFLRNELHEERKVFEILGSKMKVEKSKDQLSGLGFSSTKRNSVVCKITGSFNRIIKIKF